MSLAGPPELELELLLPLEDELLEELELELLLPLDDELLEELELLDELELLLPEELLEELEPPLELDDELLPLDVTVIITEPVPVTPLSVQVSV
ncbi:MAG: hypothetical protein P4L83_18945 [Nevskia sp.]|nr:hypothetical protein [Nevskia sp.]